MGAPFRYLPPGVSGRASPGPSRETTPRLSRSTTDKAKLAQYRLALRSTPTLITRPYRSTMINSTDPPLDCIRYSAGGVGGTLSQSP